MILILPIQFYFLQTSFQIHYNLHLQVSLNKIHKYINLKKLKVVTEWDKIFFGKKFMKNVKILKTFSLKFNLNKTCIVRFCKE